MASRVSTSAIEVLIAVDPRARVSTSAIEVLVEANASARVSTSALEVLRTLADESTSVRNALPKVTAYVAQQFLDIRVRLPKVTTYGVMSNNRGNISKTAVYATLRPSPPATQVPKLTAYAVMLDAVPPDPILVAKVTPYAVMDISPERVHVTKQTLYVALSGEFRASKFTPYAVLDDPTPRFVDVPKITGYAVTGNITVRVTKATPYAVLEDVPRPIIRVTKVTPYAIMAPLNPKVYLSEIAIEALTGGSGRARAPLVAAEALTTGNPVVRAPLMAMETITSGFPIARCALMAIDVVCGIPEEPMSIDPATRTFPTQAMLPGLSFTFGKKPNFSTRVAGNISGKEVRNAFYEDPRWDFELTFDYLPDYPVINGYSQIRKLQGFWLSRRGMFESFLYKDTDDYIGNNLQGLPDGVVLEFPLRRDFGGFLERIGQLDDAQPYEFWWQTIEGEGEAHTVPVTPGPYTVTVTHAAEYRAEVQVTLADGTVLNKVSVAPGPGEYIVNTGTGIYTFNAAQQGEDVLIYYAWDITETWEILMPNKIVFDVAPTEGKALYGSFQFYFVCRFNEDIMDTEKFMDKLWELQTITFKSEIS